MRPQNWFPTNTFAFYFGQPLIGRFFCRDFLIADFQLPFSFSLSGSGPRKGLSGPRIGCFLADFMSA
jgi:hypothetical protein